jgi:hypothetical protein
MKSAHSNIEKIATFLAAFNCVGVPVWIGLNQISPGESWLTLFPFPLMYLIEISLLGILGLISIFMHGHSNGWRWILWVIMGILISFVILGAWTIGLFLIPGTILWILIGFSRAIRRRDPILRYVLVALIAGFVQTGVILTLANIL